MGLFSFLAEAGEKLGITGGDDHKKAEAIQQKIQTQNLNIDGLQVKVDGKKVTLEGKAASQEAREKAILAAGNIEGVEQVEDKTTVTQAVTGQQPAAQFYTVQKGDTLGKIAQHFYGNPSKYNVLFEANKPMLKSADAIYPGQQLRIPDAQQAAA